MHFIGVSILVLGTVTITIAIVTSLILQKFAFSTARRMATDLVALEFEVFGKVQGVFFRKFTVSKGKELGLTGWCRNTEEGSVLGEMEGPSDKVQSMKEWLRATGSPKSKITKAEFRNERTIQQRAMQGFEVRRF